MSTTSGPMVPPSTGNSTLLSPMLKAAFLPVVVVVIAVSRSVSAVSVVRWYLSCLLMQVARRRALLQQARDLGFGRVGRGRAAADEIPQLAVRQRQQALERLQPL